MPLLNRIWIFFGWFGTVLGAFLRTYPILTSTLILNKGDGPGHAFARVFPSIKSTPAGRQLLLAARDDAFEELVLTRGRFNDALKLANEMLRDLEARMFGHDGG